MTTPSERTSAILRTAKFLEKLATAEGVSEGIRREAAGLARHFPRPYDIELVAAVMDKVNDPSVYPIFSIDAPDLNHSR
ncbi:hypothetical protein SAMN02745857_03797 [Andreprevotia lacus DSM 23236]|jgi:hypothetical protein|uniref:Uncharacterized protein n=1 Tax=Andreprevotia lacus DSM 23236 TaxID=1121001 RepID=A0A1W1Y0R5_9NEIS|nr:BPSL0761 family protein [Andreprevotia lacus]SMC29381.1 hypothetical protein SAMN02745857_03797 [Andreprevotia lacus DSM 23236]